MKHINPSSAEPEERWPGIRKSTWGFSHPIAPGFISNPPSPLSLSAPFACKDPGVCWGWKAGSSRID